MNSSPLSRRRFLKTASAGCAALTLSLSGSLRANSRKPNVLVIFCDDMGYGDLSTFGHPTISTPNLDRLAAAGQKWTNFYAAAGVCTPSRAGLLTGRLPVRSGMCSDERRVLFPDSSSGLLQSEITIARAVKNVGYATACIGKWHLGHLPPHLPTYHGFDYYFGIPYSNDMDKVRNLTLEEEKHPKIEDYNVPLMRNEEIIERPAEQHTLTQRYTKETIGFIKRNKDHPWFVYLAHTMVHVPLFVSPEFEGKSVRGLYGDAVAEIDAGVEKILQTLRELNLEKNTLVVFTSDNGPWLLFEEHGGSAGLLRNGKGTTWEGGMREPTIFYWPAKIRPGVITDIGSTLDLFATVAGISGAETPSNRIMDSYDLTPTLFDGKPSPRREMFYYRGTQVYAARLGAFKAHYITENEYVADRQRTEQNPPLLFNLDHDPSEKYNMSAEHPKVIEEITALVERHRAALVKGEDQLRKRIGE